MSSSWTMRSAPTRKQRRGRMRQLSLTVLIQGIRWCTIMAPPTRLISSSSTSSGLPTHLSVRTSRQHLRPYLHHRQCRACLRHRPQEPLQATLASTMVAQATLLESAPCQRRTLLRATSPHPPRGPQKVTVPKTVRVNYTTMEDIPEGKPVITGTFSLNGHSIVVLFDSGATHDCVSKACTQKCKLVIENISVPYMISTLGGRFSPSK
jgi:hypothetical protein